MSDQKSLIYGGKIPYVEPLTEERAAYNETLALYEEEGAFSDGYDGPPIAPFASTLRSDIELIGTNAAPNVLTFNFRTNEINAGMVTLGDADNRLNDNDAFMVREVALLWGVKVAAAANSSAILQQWPNPRTATGLVGGGFDPSGAVAVLRALNGQMDLEVNAVKYMEGLDCLHFMYSDSAQAGLAQSDVATTGVQSANAFEGRKGWKSLTPQLRFSGSDKTRFQVRIPTPATFIVSGMVLIASLQLRGLRIQNGGKFVPRGR